MSLESREAVLVVNTQSRRGERSYARAKRELRDQGVRLAAAYPVRDASRIPAVVEGIVAEGCRFVIVGGGDGTISSVMSSFAGQDICLGLLPMGTANNFARANGIPLDLEAAAKVIATGRIARVDLGEVDGKPFTNAVSIGLTSAIHRGSPDGIKRVLGRLGYLVVAARRFAQSRAFRCRLIVDGEAFEMEALDVRVANGPFQGGIRIVDEASVESGELAVRIVTGPSKWALGRAWGASVFGRPAAAHSVRTLRGRNIEISASPTQFVSVDGEVITQTPVRIAVMPAALQIIVPEAEGPA